jgi:diguanylate cyclase (GGDEF)-like protein
VVVLSELDGDKSECVAQASIVAEKIRSTLSTPYWLASNARGSTKMIVHHNIGASIGVALFDSQASAENILKWADKAMYQAKEAGRNQIQLYMANA